MTHHLDALRHVAGTHPQPWGAWLGAVLEEMKERGWVRRDGDVLYGALTEAGEAELARLERAAALTRLAELDGDLL